MKNGFSATFAESDGTETAPTMMARVCLNVITVVIARGCYLIDENAVFH